MEESSNHVYTNPPCCSLLTDNYGEFLKKKILIQHMNKAIFRLLESALAFTVISIVIRTRKLVYMAGDP